MSQLSIAGTSDFVLPPDADPDRDCWCTPKWLTDLLPEVDLDPCSNPRSTVRAKQSYSREQGQDGLSLPWHGLVWLNPPYSHIEPWSTKALHERIEKHITGVAFLVNLDASTHWWSQIARICRYQLAFTKRIQFMPPPGVEASTNSKPQALLMDDEFLGWCESALLCTGTLWERR